MDQHRPDLGVADVLEHLDQRAHVMPVDRPDIIEAELVEERAAGQPAAGIFLHLAGGDVQRVGHRPRQLLRQLARRQIFARADTSRASAVAQAIPTGGAIDMSLSLRMTISRLPAAAALFIAS